MNDRPNAKTPRAIVIIDISPLTKHLLDELEPYVEQYRLEGFTEDVFDYIIARSLQLYYTVRVNGRVLNLQHNDLYRVIFDHVEPVFMKAIFRIMQNYNIAFQSGEQVKILSTYHEIILVRFPANSFHLG